MIAFMIQYWWGNLKKAIKNTYLTCSTCPKYNLGKTVCTGPGSFKLPNGPFESWQTYCIQPSLSHKYTYVLVMISMFSRWTEAFPCRQANPSSVAQVLLEKIIPPWRVPLKLHSDEGPHFTGQVLWQVCAVWSVLQHFYCIYDPQFSGLVECTNCIFKIQMAKFVEILQIPWPKALLLILLNLRSTSFGWKRC